MTPFSLCVYCASRPGKVPAFTQAAQALGEWLGSVKGQLVYGGGNHGLMGTVATATLAAGGRVVGVIPHDLVGTEEAKEDCTELHVVENMHQRKALMAKRAHAFLALPGGTGTLEELFEIWTWRQLAYHHKPIGLLNVQGYYDGLLSFLASCISTQLMVPTQMSHLQVGTEVVGLLENLYQGAQRNYPDQSSQSIPLFHQQSR